MTAPPPKTKPVPVGPNGVDPTLTIPPILNYLRDQDIYRDPAWKQNFDAIEKYLDACQEGRLNGDLGYGSAVVLADLDLACSMVLVHRRYQKWNMDKTPWSTKKPPVKLFSDRLLTYPKVHPKPCDGNNRALIQHKRLDVPGPPQGPSIFYTPAPQGGGRTQVASDGHYRDLLIQDQTQFWDGLDQHLAQKRNDQGGKSTPAVWTPPQGSLYNTSNQIFQRCIRKGIAETNFRNTLESLPPPTASGTPWQNQFFARKKGINRAALQQLLNLFSNHENRAINTPWRRVVLPYDSVALPKEVSFQPRILAENQVPHLGKEPFPWVHWYNGYTSYLDHVAVRKRARFNQEHWNEKDRSCLPVNFRGPFITNGHSVQDNYWLKAGKWLVDLEAHLRDRNAIYPRPLLKAMLNDIDAGKIYPYQAPPDKKDTTVELERQLFNNNRRRDLFLRDEDDDNDGDDANAHGGPNYKLLTEREMTWLKFVGEPPRSKQMMDKVDELRQDNLALIFDNRLQEVLRSYGTWEEAINDDPNDAASITLFGNLTEPLPIDELLEKINGAETDMLPDDFLRHPNQSYQFTIEEVEHYLRVLWRLDRCTLYPASEFAVTKVGPSKFNLFPEDRILWRHDDNQAFADHSKADRREFISHMVDAYQDTEVKMKPNDPLNYTGILEHRRLKDGRRLEDVMAACEDEPPILGRPDFRPTDLQRTQLLRLWVPESHYVRGEYGDDEPQPSVDDLASWEQLWHWVSSNDYNGTAEWTCQFLRGLAFRMGTTIQYYNNLQTNLQGATPIDSNDAIRELDHWATMVDAGETFTNTAADGSTVTNHLDTPGAQSVVDKADPDQVLASTTPNKDPFVLIKKGLINDCVENRNMLYPGRLSAFRDKSQTPFQGIDRPNLWSWATSAQRKYQAPYTRKTFFNMRRWPLHHQSDKRQGWIKNRQDEIIRADPRIQNTGILTARIEPAAMSRRPPRQTPRPPRPRQAQGGQGPDAVDDSTGEEAQRLAEFVTYSPNRSAGIAWDPYDTSRGANETSRLSFPDYLVRETTEDTDKSKTNETKPIGNQGHTKTTNPAVPTNPTDPIVLINPTGPNGPNGPNGPQGPTNPPTSPGGKSNNNKLNPIIRSHQDWIPGPAVYPMGDTLLQQIMISKQLENAIYPPDQVPWGEFLTTKFWQMAHKKPPQIPLLPEGNFGTIVRSHPLKRKLPPDYLQNGPAKRPRAPGPPDTRPDSGRDQIPGRRFFRRPGANNMAPQDITADRDCSARLQQAFPGGYERIQIPTNPSPNKGVDRGAWAIERSIESQHNDLQLPSPGRLAQGFRSMAMNHPKDWLEVRKHNGVVDESYSGPPFADQMAGALYEYGQTVLNQDLALGIIDSRAPKSPFVHPLPRGHNSQARVVWVFYDGQGVRWRPTPPRKDQAWELGDFDYWYGVQVKQPATPEPATPEPEAQDTGSLPLLPPLI